MAFKPIYHEINLENLQKLGDKTKEVALKWYEYLIENGIDVLIYETIRTKEQQEEYVRKGVSKTMKSYHLVGQALDFVPVKDGKADWNGYDEPVIKKAIAKAKELGFTWGGDWKTFKDKPHLQYDKIPYGSDTFKTKDVKVVIPTPKVVTAKAELKLKATTTKSKAPAKPASCYKIGEVTGDVWLHKTPDFKEDSRIRVLKKGEKYRVYGEVNGMYNLGNSYVSKKYIKIL